MVAVNATVKENYYNDMAGNEKLLKDNVPRSNFQGDTPLALNLQLSSEGHKGQTYYEPNKIGQRGPSLDDGDALDLPSSSLANTIRPHREEQLKAEKAEKSKLYPSRTVKKYQCTWESCNKAYTKPSKLREHELTHKGERPFVCPHCQQAYFRDSHLKVHMRSAHEDHPDKPFKCRREGCSMAFWTRTKLSIHQKTHEKEGTFVCTQCDDQFTKENQLREHIASKHMPAGTKPFICEHDGCDKSFAMKAQLKSHLKIHNTERYTCSHPSHGGSLPCFSKLTELQKHITAEHPPVCPHSGCNGRVFKTPQCLKEHLRVHAEQEADSYSREPGDETKLPPLLLEGMGIRKRRKTMEELDEQETRVKDLPKKLRRCLISDAGKDWPCEYKGCGKTYKSKLSLDNHIKIVHHNIRPFTCPQEGCDKAYAHKVNLTQHLQKHRESQLPKAKNEGQLLTGAIREIRRFTCPAHAIGTLPKTHVTILADQTTALATSSTGGLQISKRNIDDKQYNCNTTQTQMEMLSQSSYDDAPTATSQVPCIMRFWRVYDVRRHLHAAHGIELDDMEVRRLLLSTGQTGE
ncbi:uncharacterized protein L203_105265 [Cryptococcus depauperatus CBS 7841]|uniref:C2H2-type domain-containing protein n=1 Tax=Cryptococcus depauperatus CBS 7841 TaxID=1295531 RepID=A0AAJ8JX27_9TREE